MAFGYSGNINEMNLCNGRQCSVSVANLKCELVIYRLSHGHSVAVRRQVHQLLLLIQLPSVSSKVLLQTMKFL